MNENDNLLDQLQEDVEVSSTASWFKFEKPGDKIQGTYIGRREEVSSLGQEQVVYTLLTPEGAVNVARPIKDVRTARVMDGAGYGQIVRFAFLSEKPHTKKGYNPIKIIEAVTRADIVDADWLKKHGATEPIPVDKDAGVDDESLGDDLGVDSMPTTDAGVESSDDSEEEGPYPTAAG